MSLCVVSNCANSLDAHLLKNNLAQDDVPAFLLYEHHHALDWTGSLLLGGIKVAVPLSYQQQALAIIKRIDNGDYQLNRSDDAEIIHASTEEPASDLGEPDMTLCPKCHSQEYEVIATNQRSLMFMTFIFIFFEIYNVFPGLTTLIRELPEYFRHTEIVRGWSLGGNSLESFVLFCLQIIMLVVALFFISWVGNNNARCRTCQHHWPIRLWRRYSWTTILIFILIYPTLIVLLAIVGFWLIRFLILLMVYIIL